MKYLLFAAGLLFAAPSLAQNAPTPTPQADDKVGSIEALDAKNGFRTYRFGTPISQLPELQKRAGFYVNPLEILRIGDVTIANLKFIAIDNKLAGVTFTTSGTANCQKLVEILQAQYGAPQQATYNKRAWVGATVSMIYEETTTVGTYGTKFSFAGVYILNNELAVQQKAADTEKARKAAANGL